MRAHAVACTKHPEYKAERASKSCPGCYLIFVLKYQHCPDAGVKLGGLNPYQFVDLVEALELLEVSEET